MYILLKYIYIQYVGIIMFCILYTVTREIFVLKYFHGLNQPHFLIHMNKFRARNIRGLGQPRKYFNNENFPNYGTYILLKYMHNMYSLCTLGEP